MKLFALLFEVLILCLVTCKNIDKQSIHLSANKLEIVNEVTPNNKIVVKKNKESANKIEDKNVFDMNFSSQLKQAEQDLLLKLKNMNNKRIDNLNQTQTKNDTSVNEGEISPSSKLPVYRIENISTVITVDEDKTQGNVLETVKFVLANGTFSSIIRKISLTGSSDSLIAFKLSSTDIKLKEARIINNCFEEENKVFYESYLCLIAIFEEVDAKLQDKVVEIEYEYIALNFLRLKEKSEYNKESQNTFVWYFDNYKRMHFIGGINLSIVFNNNKLNSYNITDFTSYPDKISYELIKEKNQTAFHWHTSELKANSYQKFSLDMKLFNEKCRKIVKYL